MINVNSTFKTLMKKPIKELSASLIEGEHTISSSDDLIELKITTEGDLLKTCMRRLEARYLGNYDLLGKYINANVTVKGLVDDINTEATADYGSFMVQQINYDKEKETTSIVAYDNMVNSMRLYTPLGVTYPITLKEYIKILATNIGLIWDEVELVNGNLIIEQDLWLNIKGITFRDILTQIAQATASTCIIHNDKLLFKYPTDTEECLTYSNLKTLKLEPKYGEINSVVLSRTPQEDNIFLSDNDSIIANGLTEIKIENNEIIDKKREEAIVGIFNKLKGFNYYPFDVNTEGLGWYEIGDIVTIIDNLNNEYNTTIFNSTIHITGSIKENLNAKAQNKTQTQYQYATSINKRLKNTEIVVNKQENFINQLVEDVYEEDGLIHENFTQIYQDIDNIINNVQTSGGDNLIKNSVLFAFDDSTKLPLEWTVSGDGTLTTQSSAEAQTGGSISGHVFILNNKTITQRVPVVVDNDKSYTFSCKIKKNTTGSCYIKLKNSIEEHIIEIPVGQSPFYSDFELKDLKPKAPYYDIEVYGSNDSEATFTDLMLNLGSYKTQWTQASGEIMNTQVNINVNGVLVKSSVYVGDYTIMSPLEFAGYTSINGQPTKIFSINKDTTIVNKLYAEDEIAMTPIKIVPITTGDKQGWAFVKSIREEG